MNLHPEQIEIRPWSGEAVTFATHKLNGHRLTVIKDACGRVSAFTTVGHDIVDQLKWMPWYEAVHRHVVPATTLVGELHVPGRPPSCVKTAINEQDSALRFEVFAIPIIRNSFCDSFSVNTVDTYCKQWGLRFAPWELYDSDTNYALKATEMGIEGFVLKQSNWRGWYKIKPIRTIDCVVTGFKDGEGKYLGWVGALLCSVYKGDGVLVEIASAGGMEDNVRYDIDEKTDLGKIVELKYQYVGSKGRLIHPRFVGWRDDPHECAVSQDPDLEDYWNADDSQTEI